MRSCRYSFHTLQFRLNKWWQIYEIFSEIASAFCQVTQRQVHTTGFRCEDSRQIAMDFSRNDDEIQSLRTKQPIADSLASMHFSSFFIHVLELERKQIPIFPSQT